MGGTAGISFSVPGLYSQTIPMVARNTGTGATAFVDAYVNGGGGVTATLPSGFNEIRGSFLIPLS